MRYEVFGFNQAKVVEQFGKSVGTDDLLLLSYIIDAVASPKMQHILVNGIPCVWLKHEKIQEDLPILGYSGPTLINHLNNLCQLGLLFCQREYQYKGKGSRSFYGITETCENLRFGAEDQLPKMEVENTDQLPNLGVDALKNDGPTPKNGTSDSLLKEKEIDRGLKREGGPAKSKTDIVVEAYNRICTRLSKVKVITAKRKKAIEALLKHYTLQDLEEAFAKANESDFCSGRNNRGWTADLDFILREDKFVALLEGKYNNHGSHISSSIEQNVQSSSHRADMKKVREDIANGRAIEF